MDTVDGVNAEAGAGYEAPAMPRGDAKASNGCYAKVYGDVDTGSGPLWLEGGQDVADWPWRAAAFASASADCAAGQQWRKRHEHRERGGRWEPRTYCDAGRQPQ